MLWMGFWSPRFDPLYASLLVTPPHTQLLAAQPHAPELDSQSNARYAAMSEPSTPALFCRVASSTTPCAGWSRKPLQAYVTPEMTTSAAMLYISRCHMCLFIVFRPSPSKTSALEGGRNPDRNDLAARIHALIDTSGFIPNIASVVRGSGGDGQRRIEPRVSAEGEQVFRLQVDARGRNPAHDGGRQGVRDLQRAQPHVRAVFHPIAAELPAEVVAVVESRILRARIRQPPGAGIPRRVSARGRGWERFAVSVQLRGVDQHVLRDVRLEIPERVPVLLRVEDLAAERAEHGAAQLPVAAPDRQIEPAGEIGVRAADVRAVGRGDLAVAVQIPELDSTRTGAVRPTVSSRIAVAALHRVERIDVVPVGDQAVERAEGVSEVV